ncbi:hypothetical protein GCM10020001_052070 [Nonomuraea salmonea]
MRLVGQRVQVSAELVQAERGVDGHAVAHHVQVRLLEVDHPGPPEGSLMEASRMFHSLGIVQSSTFVPVGTSVSRRGADSPMISRVRRSPSPVMLRHSG